MDKVRKISTTETDPVSYERNLLNVAKGGGIVYGGKLFLSLSRLVTVIVLARLLSVEQYGLYNLALSAANVAIAIAILGLDTALVRYIAIAASRKDDTSLWGSLQVGITLSVLLSALTSTLLFALAYPLATQVFDKPELAPLLQLVSLIIPFLVLSDVLAGATRGFKKMQYMVIAQHIAQPVIRLILIIVLSLTGMTPAWAIITFGVADGIASLMLLYFLNKQFSLRRPVQLRRNDFREILGFSLPLWFAELMVTFRGNVQTILLGSLSTIANVGIFSVVAQVNQIGQMLYTAVTAAARPMIAELHDRDEREQMGRLYQTTTNWVMMVNLPVFLIMVLFPVPILSIFGKSFIDGASALIILAFANFVNIGTGMCGAIIEMTGYTKLKLINTSIRMVSSIGLNLVLIPAWGLVGAAVAALAVEVIVNSIILLQVWMLFRLAPYNKAFLKTLLAGCAAFAAAFMTNQILPVDELPIYALVSLTVMLAVYAGVSLGLGLAPEDRLLVSRLQRRIGNLVGWT
ncbi:MAG TPA: flippase [Anaerolineales bacterium]|nr:flippase [Anaerolineales bacterium]